MISASKVVKRKEIWRILPGVVISLIALAVILYLVDLQEVKIAFRQADYRYFLPVVVIYTLGLLTRGMAWRSLLKNEAPLGKVFLTLNAGYLLNNILPLRLGELGRAFLLGRTGLGFWRVFSTILIERAFDLALVAGMLLSTLPFVWGAPQAQQVVPTVGILVLIALVALHILARNQEWAVDQFEKLVSRWPRLNQLGKDHLLAFFDGLAILTSFRQFLRVLGWMFITWILVVGAQYFLLLAFLPAARLLWVVFGEGVVALGVAVPSSPAYVGVLEVAWVSALALFGVQPSTALAYAFASHLLNIVVTGAFGVYALVKEGESLSRLYYQIRKETT